MKLNRLTKAAIVTGAVLMLFGGAVSAGTSMVDYSTTVGRFNGSGYTGYQTKASGNDKGYLYSSSVGGKYTVDARMVASSGEKAKWVRDVDDKSSYILPKHNNMNSGKSVRVEFSNDITTPVNVQVEGSWKSN